MPVLRHITLAAALMAVVAASQAGDVRRGASLAERGACASCHGADLNSPIDPSYPKIAGQYEDYLFSALRSYQIEGNPHIGRSNAVMRGIMAQFTVQEVRDLAAYTASLPGTLRVVPESRFRP